MLRLNKPDNKKMNLIFFQEEFRKEWGCKAGLFKTRWPERIKVPKKVVMTLTLYSKAESFIMCSGCMYQSSLTTGTIFHKS